MMRYILIVLLLVSLGGCKKASYLTDEGLHVAEVNMSTYDYLASHPHHMFDTLLMLIDHFDLKAAVNNSKTFWVPTDYSINKLMKLREARRQQSNENATYTLSNLISDLDVDSLKAYFSYDQQYSLNSASPSYTALTNGTGIEGFAYHRQKQAMSQWSYQDIYYLYYVKIRGEADRTTPEGIPQLDRNDPADVRVLCQTSGIRTSSGTLVNVLSNVHTFISDFYESGDTGPLVEDLPNGGLRFTYQLDFRPMSSYAGQTVAANSGWIAEAFGLNAADIPAMIGTRIKFGALEPDGTLNTNSTANAPGHWFAADGRVVSWGADARLFSEYNATNFAFNIGQYPDRSAIGDSYRIRQALEYTNRLSQVVRVEFVFRINIK